MKSVGPSLPKKFFNLSHDITRFIALFLLDKDLVNCMRVCKNWMKIFKESGTEVSQNSNVRNLEAKI